MNVKEKIQELEQRLNLENEICLSVLYERAFDKGLIGFYSHYQVVLSKHLKENNSKDYYIKFFAPFENVKFGMPQKYLPKAEFFGVAFGLCI